MAPRSNRPSLLVLANVGLLTLVLLACAAPGAQITAEGGDRREPAPGAGVGEEDGDPLEVDGAQPGGADEGDGSGNGGAVGTGPDAPVIGVPMPPPIDGEPVGDGALAVWPEPGIVNPLPHAWDRIAIGPDGRTITIYYWGGVRECYGLAAVHAVRDDAGLLHVTVFEGARGDLPPNTACIHLAVLKSVTIELDEPVVAPAE